MAAVRHHEFIVRMRWTSRDVFLVVFITVRNFIRIGSVDLITSKFNDFCDLLEIAYLHRFKSDLTP